MPLGHDQPLAPEDSDGPKLAVIPTSRERTTESAAAPSPTTATPDDTSIRQGNPATPSRLTEPARISVEPSSGGAHDRDSTIAPTDGWRRFSSARALSASAVDSAIRASFARRAAFSSLRTRAECRRRESQKWASTMIGPITAPTSANGDPHTTHNTMPASAGAAAATPGNVGAGFTVSLHHGGELGALDLLRARDNAVDRGSVKNRGRLAERITRRCRT
jgi:hypothetical protein